jgi:hypothetical protein
MNVAGSDKATQAAAPVAPAQKSNQQALEAWFKAETHEQRVLAVKAFPELKEIFSIASTIQPN